MSNGGSNSDSNGDDLYAAFKEMTRGGLHFYGPHSAKYR